MKVIAICSKEDIQLKAPRLIERSRGNFLYENPISCL